MKNYLKKNGPARKNSTCIRVQFLFLSFLLLILFFFSKREGPRKVFKEQRNIVNLNWGTGKQSENTINHFRDKKVENKFVSNFGKKGTQANFLKGTTEQCLPLRGRASIEARLYFRGDW